LGLIDSHAHLTYPELAGDLEGVLARSAQAGVDRIITIGTDPDDARKALELSKRFAGRIHAAAGLHPHHAKQASEATVEQFAEWWASGAVVAAGEIGLDYHYDFAARELQRNVFAGQLVRAKPLDLPLIIHCREAFDDLVPMLVDHGFKGRRVVFHCFTGSAEEAGLVAELGWRISFTGIVTFKKSVWLHDIARTYPSDSLMIETDSPYLSPEPVRGKTPNEPAHVLHVARFLANLRGIDFSDFVEQTERNTREFFKLAEV